MSLPPLRRVLLVLLLFLAACEKPVSTSDPDSMEIQLFRPANNSGVYLNEPLVFDFSHEIDRSSITGRSVRIELADGTPARGTIRVDGKRMVFEPAAVLSPDLTDGGYLPGQRYIVTLLGFPALDSLRGVGGEPLKATSRFPFTTVKDVEWPRENFVFADDSPERCSPLFVLRDRIAPDDAILLGCEEPLDPSTLFAEDFDLRGGHDPEPIPMSVRLVHNSASEPLRAEWPNSIRRPVAVVELSPLGSLEEAARYTTRDEIDPPTGGHRGGRANLALHISPRLRLADFSGNATPVLTASPIRVYIEEASPSSTEFREDFINGKRRKPIPIVGVDGTALWGESGRVEVRYPRAAGSGLDGDVNLGAPGQPKIESRLDVNAVSVTVGGQGTVLSSEPGLCVLRAQGRMLIEGPLRRRTGGPIAAMRSSSGGNGMDGEPRPSLTQWLRRARKAGENWTVLVAGGDLVIEGEIDTDTPLLLVAGGMIRISGEVHAARITGESSEELYLLGEGGGAIRWRNLDLEIDPPQYNRLVRPISFGVLSKQIPQDIGPIQWIKADEVMSSPAGRRGGTLQVWYVQGVPQLRFDPTQEILRTDPRLFDSPGPVHFFVRIDIPAAPESTARGLAPWSPPFLDAIILKAE